MKEFIKIIGINLSLLLFSLQGYALDIIYPQKIQYNTRASETYILGNIAKGSTLKINNENVKIWDNQIFCHIIPLKDGLNEVFIEEITPTGINKKTYKINKPVPATNKQIISKSKQSIPQIKYYKDVMFGSIKTDKAPVREKPTENSNRVTHLPENTKVLIEAEFCNWYKIYTADNENLWIYNKNVDLFYPVNNRYMTDICDVKINGDKDFQIIQLSFEFPVPFKLKENNNEIELTVWGIKDISKLEKMITKQKVFNEIRIKKYENNNITLSIPSNERLWGYDADYENSTLVFKKRKTPKINPSKPLRNIVITIDAGHGGNEKGTIGPSRIPEKDVNLAISLKLKKELEKNGAKVVMTRDCDKDTEIYQRPKIAKESKSLICLSIHSNSMVDGNPYKKHGVETYYYNQQAKTLADTIKKQMSYQLKLKDNGTNYASFVLTRATMPVSVLIEVAYMPNPEEYLKLINDKFQTQTAEAICQGLKNYLILQTENR